jgi:ParB family chromosome partitioning protein
LLGLFSLAFIAQAHSDNGVLQHKGASKMSKKPSPHKFPQKLRLPQRPSLTVQKIALALLCNSYRHQLVADVVGKLVESFNTVGQIQPISVRPDETSPGKYVVLCGAHRVAAAKKLNWTSIDALVFERRAKDLALIEIAENLHRKQLSVLNEARLEAKWLTIVRQRDVQVAQRGGVQPHDKGYSKAARLLGNNSTRDKMRRSEAIACIPDQVVPHIIKHGLENNQKALLEIAEVPGVKAQIEKVSELAMHQRTRSLPRRTNGRKPANTVPNKGQGQSRDLVEDARKPRRDSRGKKGTKPGRRLDLNALEAAALFVKLEQEWESLLFRQLFEKAPLDVRKRLIDEVFLRGT